MNCYWHHGSCESTFREVYLLMHVNWNLVFKTVLVALSLVWLKFSTLCFCSIMLQLSCCVIYSRNQIRTLPTSSHHSVCSTVTLTVSSVLSTTEI